MHASSRFGHRASAWGFDGRGVDKSVANDTNKWQAMLNDGFLLSSVYRRLYLDPVGFHMNGVMIMCVPMSWNINMW